MNNETVFDVATIGAGAAGLTASIESATLGMSTVLLERGRPGGAMNRFARVEAGQGLPSGLDGPEFTRMAVEWAEDVGVSIQAQDVVAVRQRKNASFVVDCASGTSVEAKVIIIAAGAEERPPSIPGIDELFGAGVYTQLPDRLPAFLDGRPVVVAGGWGREIERICEWPARVHVVTNERCAESSLPGALRQAVRVSVSFGTEIMCVDGIDRLESIVIRRKRYREIEAMEAAALFLFSRSVPRTSWLPPRVAMDGSGFVLTGTAATGRSFPDSMEYEYGTSWPGVFAVGSVSRTWRRLNPFDDAVSTARQARMYLDRTGRR